MGLILPVLLCLATATLKGQGNSRGLTELYAYVHHTDSLLDRSEKTFYLEKFFKVVYFEIVYIIDSIEFSEVYYLKRGNLVCAEEYEKITYSYFEDRLKYGGIYYFESAMPSHIVTLGKRSDPIDFINPEDLALSRFEKRYAELKMHLPMLLPY